MVFSSLLFLFRFLPMALLVYYITPICCRNLTLLLFSLIFYAWGEPVYVFLMLAVILLSYVSGLLLERFKQNERRLAARIILALAVVCCLLLLGIFKYADFLIENVNKASGGNFALLNLALPIGISFYLFQSLSYLFDVYRGQTNAQKSLITFGAYVAMFPQLIAGPIVQYKSVAAQLQKRRETFGEFALGVHRFVLGLGKKVLLANNLGLLWRSVQAADYQELPLLTAWLGLAAYTLQIYFDFSGYSDMAIGLGHMFGFRFAENFNYPYISKSITEFWRRWHISLGSWFREYVYIPLGGNRAGALWQVRNILTVWLLTGVWHGASWNFVLWGGYYGLLLLVEKFVLQKHLLKLPNWSRHVYCLFLVMLGWSLFTFDDLERYGLFLQALFGCCQAEIWNQETIYLLYNYVALLLLAILGATRLPRLLAQHFWRRLSGKPALQSLLQNAFYTFIFILAVAWLVDDSYNPFLYFRF